MVCRAARIDVATGDYTLLHGEYVEDLTSASEVILTLRSKRGSSAIAPWIGSRLHTIRKVDKRSRRLAEFYAKEALQYLVDRGALRDLRPVGSIVNGGISLVVNYTDRAGQRRSISYTHSVTA